MTPAELRKRVAEIIEPATEDDVEHLLDYIAKLEAVAEASVNLRAAQRAYMANRGNNELGQKVAATATNLDTSLQQAGFGNE